MTKLTTVIEQEEAIRFSMDPKNRCHNINSFVKCIDCTGYSSLILCEHYQSDYTLEDEQKARSLTEGLKFKNLEMENIEHG